MLLLAALPGCGGCAGAPGHIVESRADTKFVSERSPLVVHTVRGIERLAIDGSERKVMFARRPESGWGVLDVAPDFGAFLLQTSDTELFVGDVATGAVRAVPAPGHRVSTARFSPDGKRFAVARHSDYKIQGGKEDDTIYIVDTATLATEEIAPATESWPSHLRWAVDSSGIWVEMNWSAAPQWISLPDKVRHQGMAKQPIPLDDVRRPRPTACPQRAVSGKWDSTIRVLEPADDPDGGGRVVVELRGRKRGFHDYQADFHGPTFTPSCGYVVFGFHGAVWIADARGGAAAPLLDGAEALFFAPQ